MQIIADWLKDHDRKRSSSSRRSRNSEHSSYSPRSPKSPSDGSTQSPCSKDRTASTNASCSNLSKEYDSRNSTRAGRKSTFNGTGESCTSEGSSWSSHSHHRRSRERRYTDETKSSGRAAEEDYLKDAFEDYNTPNTSPMRTLMKK